LIESGVAGENRAGGGDRRFAHGGERRGDHAIRVDVDGARPLAAHRDFELYQPDKRHPTLAGSYLAAATSFATLTGKTPIGNSYDPGIDADTLAFLQSVAWDTVKEYFGRQ